jgi:hypothetical protein
MILNSITNLVLNSCTRNLNVVLRDGINIFFLNINRAVNKLADLEYLLHTFNTNIHVIILCETWIKKDEEVFINLEGYKSYHCTRPSKTGGGISVFVRNEIHSEH